MSAGSDIRLSALKFLTLETEHICRLCFASTAEEKVAFDDYANVESRNDELVRYSDMFCKLGVPIEQSLPQWLCQNCADLTNSAYTFQKLCHDSKMTWDSVLEKLLSNLAHSENAGPNTQTVYFLINDNGNHIIRSMQKCANRSKRTALHNLQEAMNPKLPTQRKKRKKSNVICEECGEKFTANCHLIKHIMKSHSNHKYPCPQCPKVFTTQPQLDDHSERMHHPKKIQCPKCAKMFSTDKMLKYHDKLHHTTAECKLCSIQFPSKKELRLHLDKHEMNNCSQCNKSFANRNSFKLHLKICGIEKNDPNFFCDMCGKGYIRKNGLRSHIKTDHGFGRVVLCKWCGKKYDAVSKLKMHIVKHTKEKNYHCEHCGNKFVTQAALMQHIRLHTGEKPFKCDMCEECFISASRRMEHKRRKHFGPEKQCPVCCMKFFTKHELTKHVERHYNPQSKLFVPVTEEAVMTIVQSSNDNIEEWEVA